MYQQNCRYFNGYKPCGKNITCDGHCPSLDVPRTTILVVHLGALGAVLRSTALLRMIKRKYPSSYITWVTEDSAKPLLLNNPYVDRVLGISAKDQLALAGMEFDVGFFIDKSPEVAGIRKLAKPDVCYGFAVDPRNGATIPANSAAIELWDMGLNNNKKFFENKKTELQLVAEALELPYRRDEYVIRLDESERTLSEERFKTWSRSGETTLIGLNTGTSGVVPNKTISIEFWRTLIKQFSDRPEVQMVLLGGSSDEERNRKISNGLSVILSPTQLGLRDGLASVNAMDVVVTGDSLGMHMAIALRKPTVAWFGPTCSHEIDLYDRGIKLATHYRCSPCWKRTCLERVPCNQAIELAQMKTAILNLVAVPKSSRESLSSQFEMSSPSI